VTQTTKNNEISKKTTRFRTRSREKMRPIESTHERNDTGDGIGEIEGGEMEPENDEGMIQQPPAS
jgi:hypothetical protein